MDIGKYVEENEIEINSHGLFQIKGHDELQPVEDDGSPRELALPGRSPASRTTV